MAAVPFTPNFVPGDFIDLPKKERVVISAAMSKLRQATKGVVKYMGKSAAGVNTTWLAIEEKGEIVTWVRFSLAWSSRS